MNMCVCVYMYTMIMIINIIHTAKRCKTTTTNKTPLRHKIEHVPDYGNKPCRRIQVWVSEELKASKKHTNKCKNKHRNTFNKHTKAHQLANKGTQAHTETNQRHLQMFTLSYFHQKREENDPAGWLECSWSPALVDLCCHMSLSGSNLLALLQLLVADMICSASSVRGICSASCVRGLCSASFVQG